MPPIPGARVVSDAMYDVRQEQYPTGIREMIRHENEVTNHRILWLLVAHGFIVNTYVSEKSGSETLILCFPLRERHRSVFQLTLSKDEDNKR
jgi:hypothetical protein